MDIEIFPHRILGTDTTEKLLNDLEALESVKRTVIQGPRLPPQDEIDRIYGDRRIIVVNGEEIELKVKTGRIFVELYDESGIDEIRGICDEHITTGFDINTSKSQYIRKQRTVSDELKYGRDTEIPEELIGIADTRSKFKDHVSILKKDTME
ncbi:MAG: methyl-coenzyme M reductase operon protein D [Methanobrevibacter ruminantium]|uniref:methyl-coenzyme M reductase operon protein D n=1 Tax=Methanobrevibacter ruminantium TaxID=83816 RepID=UPI0026F222B3|nr:methyl-coenzyme M reductase operon protein D [Methanobrevibacter ruminantium]MCI5737561.1 methyl-coenzyme M reductase operon protein D [Methanobrevibacter ruminantium]MDD6048557.1 methyl-coenzyme M reductase operon protein D [Methanobrevibacter ruminantium]MDO5842285.1 methyl-coenzyme M reductase operon protein D [Methanobrevibacter ruminantium]